MEKESTSLLRQVTCFIYEVIKTGYMFYLRSKVNGLNPGVSVVCVV